MSDLLGWALAPLLVAFFAGWWCCGKLHLRMITLWRGRAENALELANRISRANLDALDLLEDARDRAPCSESVVAMTHAMNVLKATSKEEDDD